MKGSLSDLKSNKVQFDLCNRSYIYKRHLKRHIKATHDNMAYTCQKCGSLFCCTDTLSGHIKKIHLFDDLACPVGDKCFDRIGLVAMHIKADYNLKEMYGCTKYSMKFPRLENFDRHVNDFHGRQNSYKCSQCEEVFAQPY